MASKCVLFLDNLKFKQTDLWLSYQRLVKTQLYYFSRQSFLWNLVVFFPYWNQFSHVLRVSSTYLPATIFFLLLMFLFPETRNDNRGKNSIILCFFIYLFYFLRFIMCLMWFSCLYIIRKPGYCFLLIIGYMEKYDLFTLVYSDWST
jgi:hypothetical protein